MKIIGKISNIVIKKGRIPYGFITPDTPLANHQGDVRFFADNLIGSPIESLEKGNLVEFGLKEWKKRDGTVEKVGEEVRLLNHPSSVTVVAVPRVLSNSTPTFNSDILNVKDVKEKISYCLESCSTISDSGQFEDYVFMLLRLLGIQNLYQYDKRNQAGRADGFLIIGSLAVMYDCTLRSNFDEHKKEQIENYVNKLKNSQITIDVRLTDGGARKKTLQIQGKNRQVWIITQNISRELYDVDGIRVKEISVQDLIKIFKKRLYSDAFEEEDLSASLAVIDKN